MQTIYVSPEFPLNRRMRKAVQRGKLQVVREGDGNPSTGGDQAVDAFVSAFQSKTLGLPQKLAACGALFAIGAHQGLGLKILILAPSASGKTSLCQNLLVPLLPGAQGMNLHIMSENWDWENQLEGCNIFIRDRISPLKKWGPALAEWGGNVLLCASPAEIQKYQYPAKFVRVEVSREENNPQDPAAFSWTEFKDDTDSDDEMDKGEDPRLRELREQLQGLPNIDKNSLLKKIRAL